MAALNGWQRLWILTAILWAVPVLGVAYLSWPTLPPELFWDRPDVRALAKEPADTREYEVTVIGKDSKARRFVGGSLPTGKEQDDIEQSESGRLSPELLNRNRTYTIIDKGTGKVRRFVGPNECPSPAMLDFIEQMQSESTPYAGEVRTVGNLTCRWNGRAWNLMPHDSAALARKIASAVRSEEIRLAGVVGAAWLLPMLALYGLGAMIAWVRRGFASS